MKRIGLHPSDTAAPGGKETGQRVSHYIIKHGPYQESFERWSATRPAALYADVAMALSSEKSSKAKQKVKYCCPDCDNAAWGKPKLNIMCGDCEKTMECDVPDEEESKD
jgi:hypothetical protein